MKIIGHRGAPMAAPENTMAGFIHAIAEGADGIEFDVHCTADHQFVVIHDYAVDRTTNGSGLVSDLTAGQLRQLDAGSWFHERFAAERIPLLEEVLALPVIEFELEIKFFDRPSLRRLLAMVASAGLLDRVEFTSSDSPKLMAVKALDPNARIGVFSPRQMTLPDQAFEDLVLSRAAFAGADVVHVNAEDLTQSLCKRLHRGGFTVHANDAHSAEAIVRVNDFGANRTTTDSPALALAALEPGR